MIDQLRLLQCARMGKSVRECKVNSKNIHLFLNEHSYILLSAHRSKDLFLDFHIEAEQSCVTWQ